MHGEQAAPLVVAEPHQRVERRLDDPGQRLLPLGLQQRQHSREMRGADRSRVVDDDPDRAQLALDARERLVDGGAVADVGVDRESGADRRDRLAGRVEPDVERRDARAVGGEAVTDRLADARAATGDDGDRHASPGTATSRPRQPPAASRS